jgi:putative oxidoreductase
LKINNHIPILIFTGLFFSILFIQSALDKLFNWKSELEFNKEHFRKTLVRLFVPLMLLVLTLMELSSGLLSLAGIGMMLKTGETIIPFYSSCLCATTFILLFLGQRISKDYAGAQSLVSYFIVSLIGVYCSYPG